MSDKYQPQGDREDPLDAIEGPTLNEQIEPYRRYGDTELAITLLSFQKQNQIGVPCLGEGAAFDVSSQPAKTGYDFYCPDCECNVRGVSKSTSEVCLCPLCGDTPGILALGRGPRTNGAHFERQGDRKDG
jgi:hypothetical protein